MAAEQANPAPEPAPPPSGPVMIAPGVSIPGGVVRFAYSTSRGPGGQNVNKRLTKCELRIAIGAIPVPARVRVRLEALAGTRLTVEGDLLIVADEFRSQRANREACLDRLRDLIVQAKAIPKTRRPTKPTRGSIRRRLEDKKHRSTTKERRSGGGDQP